MAFPYTVWFERRKTMKQAIADFERAWLKRLLFFCGGSVAKAAKRAGRNRTDFYRLLQRRGIDPKEYRAAMFVPSVTTILKHKYKNGA